MVFSKSENPIGYLLRGGLENPSLDFKIIKEKFHAQNHKIPLAKDYNCANRKILENFDY